ncbi:FecR domain-containing protein [Reichenbachiella agarivorans]|uniref:FecR domain-containing protein n=1 Tax=Reichenbachiella agarivorans TaxID=2979464 RepID=A0ABY6CLK0_9BACT|nr:FecR domain-containing protein [Reichenbachiella agarivorans]UXP31402.1 FecR domain-containing protein [Reichenbachiella agarivorans]
MSKEKGHIVDEEMLYRYFTGQLDVTEKQAIDLWVEKSTENRKAFDEAHIFYLDVHALSSIDHSRQAQNIDDTWEAFKVRNHIVDPQPTKHLTLSVNFLKYAAGLLILLVAGWYSYQYSNQPDEIILSAQGFNRDIELADGTDIILKKESTISYPEQFDPSERRVKLEGEAFFQVASNPAQPFVVELDKAVIQVIGTAFDVKTEENKINVHVEEGIVRFTSSQDQATLTQGESAALDLGTNRITKYTTTTDNYSFWRTKKLTFRNSKMADVVMTLEEAFDTEVVLDNPSLGDCNITVTFENEEIEHILQVIATTLEMTVHATNQTYTLSGDGCN